MKDGLDIRVYCPDGNPGNMRCVSIPNWNGMVLYISRSYWYDAARGEYRDQLSKSGVYILAGDDSSLDGRRKRIYIGQSENLRSRIEQHIEDSAKEFFDHVVCVIDHGNHLNSAHFKWAEASLVEKAQKAGKCAVENRVIPNKPSVSAADRSTIKRFLENVHRVLPLVEMNLFTEPEALILTKSEIDQREIGWENKTPAVRGEKEHQCSSSNDETVSMLSMADTEHFKILGMHNDFIVIQLKKNREVLRFSPATITRKVSVGRMAPPDWWRKVSGGALSDPIIRAKISDSIIHDARSVGHVLLDGFVGRGAFLSRETGGYYYNLGDKVLGEDASGNLTVEQKFDDIKETVLPGGAVEVAHDQNANSYMRKMAETALECRWRERNDGLAFLGWMVTAIIGGALKFRPVMTFATGANADKRRLIDEILKPFFGPLTLPLVDASETDISEVTGCDSLPVIIEFNPRDGRLQKKIGVALDVIKSSAIGGNTRVSGAGKISRARFSAFLSSNMATVGDAFPVALSAKGVKSRSDLARRISVAFQTEKCLAVRSLIIRSTAEIARRVSDVTEELADANARERLAMMEATLSVGARFFTGEYVNVWHPEAHRESGQLELLRELLAATAYKDEGQEFSIADCLTTGYFENGLWVGRHVNGVWSKEAAIAASYGFGMLDDHTMLLCGNAPRMKNLLARTQHENTDLAHYIRHLPRIESNGRNMKCAGQLFRAKELPLSVYKHTGFDPTKTDREDVEL